MILPDVLVPGLIGVLCGTAPSRASKEAAAYYAHPGNLFWPTLFATGLTPVLLRPSEYHRMPEFGLGLTDVNKTEWGADHDLSAEGYDAAGLAAKLRLYRPQSIAFDSKNAAQAFLGCAVGYGRQPCDFEGIAVFVLPSPSGRARRFWDEAPWRDFAAFVKARRT